MVNGETSKNENKVELEKKRLISEIKRNESEAQKFDIEAKIAKKEFNLPWYLGKICIGSFVTAGLLVVWIVGYFGPILKKEQEMAKLETQALKFKNTIKQTELEQKAKVLSDENKKIKNDYNELISQNKILEKEQQKIMIASEKLRNELKKTKDLYSELSKKYKITVKERKKYAELAKKSEVSLIDLEQENKKLMIAQEETANRIEKLSESYVIFGVNGVVELGGEKATFGK